MHAARYPKAANTADDDAEEVGIKGLLRT